MYIKDMFSLIKKFLNPNTADYWDQVYSKEIDNSILRTDGNIPKLLFLFEKSKCILDFGTGTGANVYQLCKHVRNKRITLLDHSVKALDYAKKELLGEKDKNNNEFIYVSDLKDIGNQKYDVVMAIEVIEHIREYKNTVNELWNLVNANGYLLISVPVKGWRDRHREHVNKFTIARMFHLLNTYSEWVHISPRSFSRRSKILSTAYFYIKKLPG